MKKMIKLFALAIVMLSFAASTFAQATATATATIVAPLAINKTADMNFGNIAPGAAAGTVLLSPAGARTPTGVTFLPSNPGTVTAASFTVTGLSGATYSITLPGAATTVTSGANTMTVSTWTSTPTPTGTLTGGTEILKVGATLNVGASQAVGSYVSGTAFTVTVNYN